MKTPKAYLNKLLIIRDTVHGHLVVRELDETLVYCIDVDTCEDCIFKPDSGCGTLKVVFNTLPDKQPELRQTLLDSDIVLTFEERLFYEI